MPRSHQLQLSLCFYANPKMLPLDISPGFPLSFHFHLPGLWNLRVTKIPRLSTLMNIAYYYGNDKVLFFEKIAWSSLTKVMCDPNVKNSKYSNLIIESFLANLIPRNHNTGKFP